MNDDAANDPENDSPAGEVSGYGRLTGLLALDDLENLLFDGNTVTLEFTDGYRERKPFLIPPPPPPAAPPAPDSPTEGDPHE